MKKIVLLTTGFLIATLALLGGLTMKNPFPVFIVGGEIILLVLYKINRRK